MPAKNLLILSIYYEIYSVILKHALKLYKIGTCTFGHNYVYSTVCAVYFKGLCYNKIL